MRAIYFLLTGLLSFSTGLAQAQAGDHLSPPADAFLGDASYRASVGRKLGSGLARPPLVQVVVLPSFKPEYLLSVEQTGAATILTYRQAQRSIWEAFRHEVPANVTFLNQYGTPTAPPRPRATSDSIRIITYQVKIQPKLAQALVDLFHVALAQTHYANDHLVRIDGTQFTFIAWDALVGYRSGDTWSPTPESNMGRLVNIVASLQDLVTHTDERDFRQGLLFSEAQDLLFDLAKR